MTGPSLFEFAGGADALLALDAATHERCLQDPELNHPFSEGLDPNHVEHLAAYWGEVLGGPPRYSESLGGHGGMLGIHAGHSAPPEMGERFTACFVQAMDDVALPADPAFRAAMRAYMEWASAEVVEYSPQGSVVPEGMTVPRWSWDGLVTTPV